MSFGGMGSSGPANPITLSSNYHPVTALGSDLIEMWDAARGDTISTLSDATYTAVVSSWLGLVTGANLAQSTPALKPPYAPAGLAGSPCISFNGTSQYLTCTDAAFLALLPSGATPSELWVVCSQDALVADTTERYVAGWSPSSVVEGRSISRVVVTGVNRVKGRTGVGATAPAATDETVDFSGVHVIRQTVGATQSSISIDGSVAATVSAVPATVNSRFRVGAISAAGASNYWQGKVSVVLVTKPLSAFQAASLRSYLG